MAQSSTIKSFRTKYEGVIAPQVLDEVEALVNHVRKTSVAKSRARLKDVFSPHSVDGIKVVMRRDSPTRVGIVEVYRHEGDIKVTRSKGLRTYHVNGLHTRSLDVAVREAAL